MMILPTVMHDTYNYETVCPLRQIRNETQRHTPENRREVTFHVCLPLNSYHLKHVKKVCLER